MKSLFLAFFVIAGTITSHADNNLLPNGKFESNSVGTSCDVPNGENRDAITGWRCINVGQVGTVTQRSVHFEIMKDPDTGLHYLAVEITANPTGDATGNVGFDIYANPLSVTAGDHYTLRFRAKRFNGQPCDLLAILAGHTEAIGGSTSGLVSQQPQSFGLTGNFSTYTISDWVVPAGATKMNVIFNLINYVQPGTPFQPSGISITDVDLEKTN